MKRDPFNQVIRESQPKRVFVNLLKKYLGINAGIWSNFYVWFWIFENFVRIFEMYEFFTATFIKVVSYQIFDVKCYGEKLVAHGFHSW